MIGPESRETLGPESRSEVPNVPVERVAAREFVQSPNAQRALRWVALDDRSSGRASVEYRLHVPLAEPGDVLVHKGFVWQSRDDRIPDSIHGGSI